MPLSDLDLIQGGVKDFKLDNLVISAHAKQQCKKRGIPLEDLRRSHGNQRGYAVQRGNTVVTALLNTMNPVVRTPGPGKEKTDLLKEEIRKRKEAVGVCKSMKVKSPADYEFFRALFQYHPEGRRKRVSDIQDLYLIPHSSVKQKNKDYTTLTASELTFVAIYSDETTDTISLSDCIRPYLESGE